MKNPSLACLLVLGSFGCSGEFLSLDCVNDSNHSICDENIGAFCDASVHRCLCDEKSENCPCVAHSQCQSRVCDFSRIPARPVGDNLTGTCVPSSKIAYLHATKDCSPKGSRLCPYATFADALNSARANNQSFIQMNGKYSVLDLVVDNNNKSAFPISIIGNYENNTLFDFIPPESRPDPSIFSDGVKITQSIADLAFSLTFDGVQIVDGISLEGKDGTQPVTHISILRSNITNRSGYPVSAKDFNIYIDKSTITSSTTPLISRASTINSFSTKVTNSVLAISQRTTALNSPLIKGLLASDDAMILFNSIITESVKLGYCRTDAEQVRGNLFWASAQDCTDELFKSRNGMPDTPQPTAIQAFSSHLSCVLPYQPSDNSSLRIRRALPVNSSDIEANWDFCDRKRGFSAQEVWMGAFAAP